MRALIWITENTWRACIDEAGEVLGDGAEVALLHVAATDVEELVAGGRAGLLGRRPPRHPGPPPQAISDEEAQALLEAARDRLGRPAQLIARRGRTEREVLEACADTDLLVMARDGERRLGPPSLGPRTRFVLDHAPCRVLLVWASPPPGLDTLRLPPHLRS
ncbi:MAG TPA: universal stress protein [Solirubrobacteraceae bacterium]|nr:universal stress protein [Solirubrobacteraceae bacterium]